MLSKKPQVQEPTKTKPLLRKTNLSRKVFLAGKESETWLRRKYRNFLLLVNTYQRIWVSRQPFLVLRQLSRKESHLLMRLNLLKRTFLLFHSARQISLMIRSIGLHQPLILANQTGNHLIRMKRLQVLWLMKQTDWKLWQESQLFLVPKQCRRMNFWKLSTLKTQDLAFMTPTSILWNQACKVWSWWDKIDQTLKRKKWSQELDNTTWLNSISRSSGKFCK